jgi:hypothetical protein
MGKGREESEKEEEAKRQCVESMGGREGGRGRGDFSRQ